MRFRSNRKETAKTIAGKRALEQETVRTEWRAKNKRVRENLIRLKSLEEGEHKQGEN